MVSANDTMGLGTENSVPSGRREALILFTLLAISISALAAVSALVSRFEAWQNRLAQHMKQQGELAFAAGQSGLAITFFRSALTFSRNDPVALLKLAECLRAENRLDESEAYLHTLWDREPQDATVNLELARLATRRGQINDALRYYHNAIYGIWSSAPLHNRIAARFEVIEFLLRQNAVPQAQSELIAMQPDLPPNSHLHTRVAELFQSIGDNRDAESEFQLALKLDRRNVPAAAGAGRAAFRLGHYRTAILYLDAAVAKARPDQETEDMLESARLVLATDPFLRNLSAIEREERILRAYRAASLRLESCRKAQSAAPTSAGLNGAPSSTPLENLVARERQLRSQMRPALLDRNPELPAAAMSFAFEVEDETAQLCGDPAPLDRALLLIARNREGVER